MAKKEKDAAPKFTIEQLKIRGFEEHQTIEKAAFQIKSLNALIEQSYKNIGVINAEIARQENEKAQQKNAAEVAAATDVPHVDPAPLPANKKRGNKK